MDKKFAQRIKSEKLYSDLKILYSRLGDVLAETRYLSNYCRAYSYQEAIYYFTPFSKLLEESTEEIILLMQELMDDSNVLNSKIWELNSLGTNEEFVFDEE